MSLFGLVKGLGSATLNLAITPLAVVKDVVDGDLELPVTDDTLGAVADDLEDAGDEFLDIFDI